MRIRAGKTQPPRGLRRCLTALALAGLSAVPLACGSGASPSAATSASPAATTGSREAARAAGAPTAAAAPTKAAAPACRPASLERQAAATLIVGLPATTSPHDPLAISLPMLGVGGVMLTQSNVQSADQVRALVSAIRDRRGAPLLVAADEEGGRVTTFGAVFGYQPSARDSAALGPDALRTRAAALAREMSSVGVNVDFAPDLDVTGAAWNAPIGDRSFSADPQTVSQDALAVARGLADGGVTPVLKHYPGLGEADDEADTHVTAPVVSTPEGVLADRDLRPFTDAIRAGAPAVMVGHAEYPALGTAGLPASLSPAIYRQLRRLPFRGVTITDSLGMGAVNLRFDFPVAAVKALAAGVDGLLATDGNQALRMRDAIVAAVRSGQLPPTRLADAAARVTALAGGDPYPLTCRRVTLPKLR